MSGFPGRSAGEGAVAVLAWIRGFFRANLLVWLGIALALFAYYCVLENPGP